MNSGFARIGAFYRKFGAVREVTLFSLERLPTHRPAAIALADFDGLDRYLLDHGIEPGEAGPRGRLREGLLALMQDTFGEGDDFQLAPERLQSALASLQASTGSVRSEVMVLARLRGLAIASPELAIADGLEIVREEALPGPLPDLGASFASEAGEPVFVLLACEAEDPRRAVHAARGVLAELLRALRLFGDGRIALDPLGWVSTGGGAWRALQLPGGPARGGTLLLTPDQEDELRAFCSLVSRRVFDGGRLDWALGRFELACERAVGLDGAERQPARAERAAGGGGLRAGAARQAPGGPLRGPRGRPRADRPYRGGDRARALVAPRRRPPRSARRGARPRGRRAPAGAAAGRDLRAPARMPRRTRRRHHRRGGRAPADARAIRVTGSSGTLDQRPLGGRGGGCGRPRGGPEQPASYAPLSLEEIFSNAAQSEEILDVFI